MPKRGHFLPLPSDPSKLTRAQALKCAAHPEVLVAAFARLAAQHTHAQHPTLPVAAALEKAAAIHA